MSSGDTRIKLNGIKDQLKTIEKQCHSSSSLVIYAPKQEHRQFFDDLCQIYLDAPKRERWLIRDAVSGRKGVSNCLLGYVYESAKQVRSTGNRRWLRIGLAAAAIQTGSNDYRDSLMALAELFVTAEEAGIDPNPDFEGIGGGIPADFHKHAVVKGRRKRSR